MRNNNAINRHYFNTTGLISTKQKNHLLLDYKNHLRFPQLSVLWMWMISQRSESSLRFSTRWLVSFSIVSLFSSSVNFSGTPLFLTVIGQLGKMVTSLWQVSNLETLEQKHNKREENAVLCSGNNSLDCYTCLHLYFRNNLRYRGRWFGWCGKSQRLVALSESNLQPFIEAIFSIFLQFTTVGEVDNEFQYVIFNLKKI